VSILSIIIREKMNHKRRSKRSCHATNHQIFISFDGWILPSFVDLSE